MKQPLMFRIYRRTLSITSYALPKLTAKLTAKRFLTPTRHERPFWERNLLKTGKEQWLSNHIKIWSWGMGPKILLIHGWDGRGSQLGFFVEPLVNAGFQVIAIDGPAHGDSPGQRTNLGEFARKLLDIEVELGQPYGVIAHSFGGPAILVAIDRGFSLNKLVLISAPSELQDLFNRFHQLMQLSSKARKHFQDYIEETAKIKLNEISLRNILREIQQPILVIHDKNDEEVPYEDALKLTEGLKEYDHLFTEGLGHRRILKSEQVLNKVVGFMTH